MSFILDSLTDVHETDVYVAMERTQRQQRRAWTANKAFKRKMNTDREYWDKTPSEVVKTAFGRPKKV